jgi:hypothetical protein
VTEGEAIGIGDGMGPVVQVTEVSQCHDALADDDD